MCSGVWKLQFGAWNVPAAAAPVRRSGRSDPRSGQDVHHQQPHQEGRPGHVGGSEPSARTPARPDVAGRGGAHARTALEDGQQSRLLPASRSHPHSAHPRKRHGHHDEHARYEHAPPPSKKKTISTDNYTKTKTDVLFDCPIFSAKRAQFKNKCLAVLKTWPPNS